MKLRSVIEFARIAIGSVHVGEEKQKRNRGWMIIEDRLFGKKLRDHSFLSL
jgi:hypothetical protein